MGTIFSQADKTLVFATSKKEPATLEHLVELEENMLKMLEKLAEKISTKETDGGDKTK